MNKKKLIIIIALAVVVVAGITLGLVIGLNGGNNLGSNPDSSREIIWVDSSEPDLEAERGNCAEFSDRLTELQVGAAAMRDPDAPEVGGRLYPVPRTLRFAGTHPRNGGKIPRNRHADRLHHSGLADMARRSLGIQML